MKDLARLILLAAVLTPALSGCGLPGGATPRDFDSLARLVPGDVSQAFFFDFKPSGDTGNYWQRIRNRLQTNSAAKEALDSLLGQFRVQELGLASFLVGPSVSGYLADGTDYVIFQVNSLSAARDGLLLQNPDNLQWEHEDYQGRTLYHRRAGYWYGQAQWRAFAAYDGLMVVTTSPSGDPVDNLRALVSLGEEQSLASLSTWNALRARLPASPMGLMLVNGGDSPQQLPAAVGDLPPGQALGQQLQALALAAIPENDGMRIEVAGSFFATSDVPAIVQEMVKLPGVDPGSWAGLPANTALAISTHEAPTVWPLASDIFALPSLDTFRDTVGLDLETDLFGADGPFSGDLALAVNPPLPDQPISQGVTAGQLLLLARGTSQDQMAAIQTAMVSRGAVLSPQTVADLELQVQVGTQAAGYAISFGFDADTFVLGTSPAIVELSAAARREGNGLVTDPVFQAVLSKMPKDPAFFFYLNSPSLVDLEKANMTAQQYEQSPELSALEVFDAVGLGLNLHPDSLEGTIHFYLRED